MIKVEFLGPIGLPPQDFDVKDLHSLKKELQKISELEPWLATCAVACNDELLTSLDVEFCDGDRIVLLPPVCGG
ncbi:molybdopterin converting factor, subunit 1 [Helicobacter mustelae]|uniref:MoaD/ThiS family protein n=1 Tax=Helicobacter mustelae TaxID=217 RepID=UPI000E0152D5|nr:MoaD/ThiS family protein [Helicobacter mustelae]STP12574.1 molybdopterin converting factor, subunit 1 [Helicobacter mustelae]